MGPDQTFGWAKIASRRLRIFYASYLLPDDRCVRSQAYSGLREEVISKA
jgi:hypothetical protein